MREPFEPRRAVRPTAALTTVAHRIGASLGALDVETAAYQAGLAYTGMLPAAHRAAHGVYYTPPALGARLIERATAAGVDWRTARVLDPACGGGAFLTPVARRIVAALGPCEPRIVLQNVAQRLRGYEIDPFAAWLSQVALDAMLLPVTRACARRLPRVVTVCDTLRAAPRTEPFDLVIGNPPYGRVRLGAVERRRFARALFGHANLCALFTDAALRLAKPGGVIALVTPASFLAGEYSKNLRALLGHDAPPVSLDFVAARDGVFDGVLQETLLATYCRGGSRGRIVVSDLSARATPAGDIGAGHDAPAYGIARSANAVLRVSRIGEASLPADSSQPWILPRSAAQHALAVSLAAMAHRLSDWGYTVSTGPLVWNRYKDQLKMRAARSRFPVIWAEAVATGGRFAWRADRRNHVPYCELRPGDEWMLIRSACVLVQRTTSKEQQRRLIAAPLPAEFVERHGAVVVENHLNMIRPLVERPAVAQNVLAAFLNSPAADRAFRCMSGSVAVSAYELESLPLPAPRALGRLRRLVGSGASSAAVEAECERLYRPAEARTGA